MASPVKRTSKVEGQNSKTPPPGHRPSATAESASPRRGRIPSERRRQAARRNAVKARQAWRQMLRRPDFILPLVVLERIYQGLVNAVRWHLTDCSARYASRFREGILAISLVRSLAAAGEKLADYMAHVQRILGAFSPHPEQIVDRRPFIVAPQKPGGAMPEATNDDPRSTNSDRQPGPRSPGAEQPSTDPAPAPPAPPPLISTLATSLAQVSWRRLRASRRHAEWEQRAVVRLFRQLARERERGQAIGAERLTGLAEDLHKVLFDPAGKFQLQRRRLNRRFEALAARLLEELSLPPMDLHVRPSPAVDAATASSPPEALGNPGVAPCRVRGALKPRKPRVKSVTEWDHRHGVVKCRLPLEDFGCRESLSEEEPSLRAGGASSSPGQDPEPARPDAAVDHRQSSTRPRRSSKRPAPAEDPQSLPDLVRRALGPNSSLPGGETDPVPAGLAEALGNRLELSRRRAQEECERFRGLLDDYVTSLGDDSACPAPGAEFPASGPGAPLTALSATLVLALREDDDARLEAEAVRFRAQLWIYLALRTRQVARCEIVLLEPGLLSEGGLLRKIAKSLQARDAGRRAEAERLQFKADRIMAEQERWLPVIESGDIRQLGPEEEDTASEAHRLASLLAGL